MEKDFHASDSEQKAGKQSIAGFPGVMEYWNTGFSYNPLFHYPTVPSFLKKFFLVS